MNLFNSATNPTETEQSAQIAQIARLDTIDLLLLGETGTGKTHLARQIHARSPRAKQPFLAINCAELSPALIETELFGHEKGSFTGALAARAGKFEAASGGTLFLDEIGELTPELQAKLLKVVEEKRVTRVGSNTARTVDVRIIYATHRSRDFFRPDFWHRIGAYTIALEPLRRRRAEIVPLAETFLAEVGGQINRRIICPPENLRLLENAPWHGNIRELRAFVKRAAIEAVLQTSGDQDALEFEITAKIIADQFNSLRRDENAAAPVAPIALEVATARETTAKLFDWHELKQKTQQGAADEFLHAYENLSRQGLKCEQVAAQMGVSRRTLFYRLKRCRELLNQKPEFTAPPVPPLETPFYGQTAI